jgi:hypothetical protein
VVNVILLATKKLSPVTLHAFVVSLRQQFPFGSQNNPAGTGADELVDRTFMSVVTGNTDEPRCLYWSS